MKAFGWFSELYEQVKDTFEFKLRTLELEVTEKISKILIQRGMSRSDLAEKLGTSRAAVSKLLNDGSNITLRRLLKISEVLKSDLKIDIVPSEHTESVYKQEIRVECGSPAELLKYWALRQAKGEMAVWEDSYSVRSFEDSTNASAA